MYLDEMTPRRVSNEKPCTMQCLFTGKQVSPAHMSLFTGVVVCFDIIVSVFFFSCGEICLLSCKLKETSLIEGRNFVSVSSAQLPSTVFVYIAVYTLL